MNLINRVVRIFEINIIKTLILNFKLLPIRYAVKMPLIVYGKYTVYDIMSLKRGQLQLECPCRRGLIKLNRRIGYNIGSKLRGSLSIRGRLIVKGECDIGQGCNISIREGGVMQISNKLSITGASKIHVYKYVSLGSRVTISWNVHVHDTDYHYYISDDKISAKNRNIEIGDNVWIGHDVTIAKGSVIPSNCIVASNSLINRSYLGCGTGLLIAGIPGCVKRLGVRPINDFYKDSQIDNYFKNHGDDINNELYTSLL